VTPEGLVVLGFGGHARSVAAVALSLGVRSLLFIDANARDGETFAGFPARRELEGMVPAGWAAMPAAGDNRLRQAQIDHAETHGWPLAKVIAKDATLDVDAEIGPGSFIGHHAHVGPSTKIGKGCIVNTGAIVDHEAAVGDYSHISVNSVVAGRSRVGRLVFLGSGATMIDGIEIADDITVGAGAVVVESLRSPGTYVGCPARLLR
jgi:sugar O-acyltransferase (sialic acid O-acetyltransferase NeuD family)